MSLRLVVSITAGAAIGVTTLGCFIARPHPYLAGLAISAGLIALTVCAMVARTLLVAGHRRRLERDPQLDELAEDGLRHASHCADHAHVDQVCSTRERTLTGRSVDGDLTLWGESDPDGRLSVVLAAACTMTPEGVLELQDTLGHILYELAASRIDDLLAARRHQEDSAIHLYGQARELIDLTTCQRSALDEGRAEIDRLRATVRRIAAVVSECHKLCDDERADERTLVEHLMSTIDEATRGAS